MNIKIEKNKLIDIPYLYYSLEEAEKKPLIIISHGYNCDQYDEAAMALKLVQKGFHVLTYDLSEHGERYSGFLERIEKDTDMGMSMLQIIDQSYSDLERLIESFKLNTLVEEDNIILVGVSLGAMLTYYALTKNKSISAAVSLIGTPDLVQAMVYGMEKESVDNFISEDEIRLIEYASEMNPLEKLLTDESRPLLIINTTKDDDVPYENSQLFYEKLKKKYDSFNGKLEFFLSEDYHVVNNEMIQYCIDWLCQFFNDTVNNNSNTE